MKRILYIGNHLSKIGKTQTTIDTLSTSLKHEGYTVFTASNKQLKLIRLLDMLFSIVKHAKNVDYVLIDTYSTTNFYYAYLCSVLCQFLNLKYLPILHGGNLPNRLQSHPKLSKTIFNNSLVNIAPSNYIKTEFEKLGYSNLICIPNSININNYPFQERDLKEVKLLWVRSFSEIYNPLLAVDILKQLQIENIPASLCMVGPDNDGSMQKTKDYAKALGVDVRFTGKLTKEAWIKLSKDFTIFINTTNFDNMPVSVIEAMALGLPVISTNVGGLPYLITHKKDGILVSVNYVEAFVNAVKWLQNHPNQVINIAQQARQKVINFDWQVVKNLWISVLQ